MTMVAEELTASSTSSQGVLVPSETSPESDTVDSLRAKLRAVRAVNLQLEKTLQDHLTQQAFFDQARKDFVSAKHACESQVEFHKTMSKTFASQVEDWQRRHKDVVDQILVLRKNDENRRYHFRKLLASIF